MDYGPIVRDTDYRSPTFNQFVANPQYTGAPVAPFSPATGATVSGASAPSSTLQQLSIGLAKGTIVDQAGVNKLYGNESYGSAVPEATPQTTRYTASPMTPTPSSSTPTPTTPKAAGTMGGINGVAPQGSLSTVGSTASGVSRYGLSGGGMSPEEEELTRQLETVEKPKTEAEIVAERTQSAQAEINAINENYNNQLIEQGRVNDMRSAEANAQSVLAGLTGSTEAGTRAVNVAGYNAQENKKIQGERTLALTTLFRSIQNDARAEARQQQQDFRTNAKSALESMGARREANIAKAEKSVVSLSSSGVTIEGLKSTDPQTYQYLAEMVGGEQQLKAMFVLNRPKETIIDKKVEGGKYVIAYQTPEGGVRIETIDLGLPPEFDGSADLGDQMMFFPKSDPSKAIFVAKTPDQLKQLQILKAQQDLEKGSIEIRKANKELADAVGAQGASAYAIERGVRITDTIADLKNDLATFDWGTPRVGFGSGASSLLRGSDARNFQAKVKTLKAGTAFSELTAMREASKTGGALGQVSNIELELLESALGALDVGQSKEAFVDQLQKVEDSVTRWRDSVEIMKMGGQPNSDGTFTMSDGTIVIPGK